MSTLSGNALKGEKGKSKFQSLDINNIYRGESLEPSQQKAAVTRCKHGMQSLGKVPTARRPPANLPSLKSESSGSEPAVSLVPTGGAGWGNKPGESQPSTPTQSNATASPSTTQPQTAPPSQVQPCGPPPAALSGPPPPQLPLSVAPEPPPVHTIPVSTSTSDKSWSSVMAGEAGSHPPSFLAHQSPQFQQEFPKLSSGDGQAALTGQKGGSDTQYGPGPSLRPQTEGSWIQGGGRPHAGTTPNGSSLDQGPPHLPPGVEVAGGRSNLGPHAPPGVAMGPAGPALQPNAPPIHGPPMHLPYRAMPPVQFPMYRGNFPPPGGFPPNFQPGMGPPRRFPGYMSDSRFMGRPAETDDIVTRPIIKEEELNHMDDIARDSSWARPDEMDYNDNEDNADDENQTSRRDTAETDKERERERDRDERERRGDERNDKGKRNWQGGAAMQPHGRTDYRNYASHPPPEARPQLTSQAAREAEDEMWKERKRQHSEELAQVKERAKQRKEEEEKRFEETRKAAQKKLQKMDENKKSIESKEHDDSTTPVIPLPDWADKNRIADREKDRSRTSSEGMEEKRLDAIDFRHPAPAAGDRPLYLREVRRAPPERLSYMREREGRRGEQPRPRTEERDHRPSDRLATTDGSGGSQNFNRAFKMPPRFLKKQAEKNQSTNSTSNNYMRTTGSPQPTGGAPLSHSSSGNSFDPHWTNLGSPYSQSQASNSGNNNMSSGRQVPRYNSESSESNTDKPARDREEDWPQSGESYDRYKYNRDSRDGREIRENREAPREGRENRDPRDRVYGGNKGGAGYYEDYRRYDNRDRRDRGSDMERSKDEDKWDRERDSGPRHFEERKEEPFEDDREQQWRRGKGKSEESDRERPQRPDSRDSRTSRESRNSRDSTRDEKQDGEHKTRVFSTWSESNLKEDKKKPGGRDERDRKDHPNRHMPGPPITREKLEESERNDPKRNLTQLKRGNEKKVECNKTEDKENWGSRPDKENEGGKTWAETMSDHERDLEMSKQIGEKGTEEQKEGDNMELKQQNEEKIIKVEKLESKIDRKDERERKREGRGVVRVRQAWPGLSVFRSTHGGRRRDPARAPAGRPRSSNRDWNQGSESDVSCDDVSGSTESGKDDRHSEKKQDGRSSKARSLTKKTEKDERNKETRKIESDGKQSGGYQGAGAPRFERKNEFGSREGFAPSGQPSRRGRGAVRMRGNISRRMDGYGPPPAKSPFSHNEDKKTPPPMDGGVEEDKTKLKQQALTASIASAGSRNSGSNNTSSNKAGSFQPRMQRKSESELRDTRNKSSRNSRRNTNKAPADSTDVWDTTSENSEGDEKKSEKRDSSRRDWKGQGQGQSQSSRSSGRDQGRGSRGAQRSSTGTEKKFNRESPGSKGSTTQGAGSNGRSFGGRPSNNASGKLEGGLSMNWSKDDVKQPGEAPATGDDKVKVVGEGETQEGFTTFQEVRAKKTLKDSSGKGHTPDDSMKPPRGGKERNREKDRDRERDRDADKGRSKIVKDVSNQGAGSHVPPVTSGPQPLMSQVVPAPPSIKSYQNKLPPRFAKQRESNRLQKLHQNENAELNKLNHSNSLFHMKEGGAPPINAWDKPIAPVLRSTSPQATEQPPSDNSSQRSSPHVGLQGRPSQPQGGEALLDGSSPPVNTIIFENTNYKSAPPPNELKAKFNPMKSQRLDKGERKLDETDLGELAFSNKAVEMQGTNKVVVAAAAVADPLALYKTEDSVDLKLGFTLESELSQLTDDKAGKCMRDLTRSMHTHSHTQSTISPLAEDLNIKIAAAKKVWERMHTVPEHDEDSVVGFSPAVDPSAFGKAVEASNVVMAEDGSVIHAAEVVYGYVAQPFCLDYKAPASRLACCSPMPVNANYSGVASAQVAAISKADVSSTTSNVCKVKPQQQAIMTSGHSPLSHTGQSPLGHTGPLSPPPYNTSQPGQFNYQQAGLSSTGGPFGGMPAIPSPPGVLYNSSTQLPTAQANIYQTFQLDGPRNQFSQFPAYGMSQGSAFSQPSMYLHPTAPPAAAADLYPSNISQYRLQPNAPPFGQSQLNSNPNTVLISSTANSLMSASVKPSTQPIGTIGSKGATPYQQSTIPAHNSQMYIPYETVPLTVNQSYLSSSQIVQRASVQPSASSFYSSSAGAQAGFYQTTGTTLQQQGPGAPQLHQAGYSLQGFNTQSSGTPVGLQNYGSQMGAQPYRTQGSVGPTTYLKSGVSHHPSDLKSSTSSQPDVLASVFASAPQIPSPKSRPPKQMNQQPAQHSPTQQAASNKFGSYQSASQASSQLVMQAGVQRVNQSSMNLSSVRNSSGAPRYPSPIQRPVSYQQHGSSRCRPTLSQPTASRSASNVKPYFNPQESSMKLEEGNEVKSEDEPPASSKAEGPEEPAAGASKE